MCFIIGAHVFHEGKRVIFDSKLIELIFQEPPSPFCLLPMTPIITMHFFYFINGIEPLTEWEPIIELGEQLEQVIIARFCTA